MNYLLIGGTAIGFAIFAHALNNLGFSFATSPMSEVILASGIGLVFTGIAATAVRNEFFRNNHHRNHIDFNLPARHQELRIGIPVPPTEAHDVINAIEVAQPITNAEAARLVHERADEQQH
jgi:hypothetical protein